jgi:hypothetical protein
MREFENRQNRQAEQTREDPIADRTRRAGSMAGRWLNECDEGTIVTGNSARDGNFAERKIGRQVNADGIVETRPDILSITAHGGGESA